jgi:hypothetical protein
MSDPFYDFIDSIINGGSNAVASISGGFLTADPKINSVPILPTTIAKCQAEISYLKILEKQQKDGDTNAGVEGWKNLKAQLNELDAGIAALSDPSTLQSQRDVIYAKYKQQHSHWQQYKDREKALLLQIANLTGGGSHHFLPGDSGYIPQVNSHRFLPGDKGYVASSNSVTPTPASTSAAQLFKKPLRFNASAVHDAYLSPAAYSGEFSKIYGKKITEPAKIKEAHDLWSNSAGHKGMIVLYIPKPNSTSSTPSNVKNGINDIQNQINDPGLFPEITERYAYQFLYNPTTITMSYQGVLKSDPSIFTAGLDYFNPISSSLSQSTIQFDLILNRMADFAYYDPTTQQVLTGINAQDIYPIPPSAAEQKEIFNKGTMYDLESLLRTLLGFGLKSKFVERNSADGLTADIGFIQVRPLELHLGKSLRYLVQISGITVKHIIFDHRMVPLLSSVTFSANRIPDTGF